jgi:apolipoprotein N-acyltransferase
LIVRSFWSGIALAVIAGALAVPAYAPLYAWPLVIISLVGLFGLWQRSTSPAHASAIGFAWGLGLFLVGVPWLYVSLHTYGDMPAPLAAIAIFLFCAYLSLFPALAGYVQAKIRCGPIWRLVLLMPAAFVAAEAFRGWFVTGFPWLIAGYTQTPGFAPAPLAGLAPLFGVFGISLVLAMTAGAVVLGSARLSTVVPTARLRRWLFTAGAVVWGLAPLLGRVEWTAPSAAPVAVSLLQGNVPQNLKWREDQAAASLENYLQLVEQSRGKLIVLPETALPFMLDRLPPSVTAAMASRARTNGGDVLLGVVFRDASPAADGNQRYFNGAVAFGTSPIQQYAKHHLVAFGEFVPPLFSWVYRWLKIPLSGFTPGAEVQPPMQIGGHTVAVNICYEDAFGAEIVRSLPAAELLINMSNMAWFGTYLAADQHAQLSQMRALESGRWMLRATNTGVTAAINDKGEIVASLPQFSRGVLEVSATPMRGATPYSRWRDWPILMLVAILIIGSGLAARYWGEYSHKIR